MWRKGACGDMGRLEQANDIRLSVFVLVAASSNEINYYVAARVVNVIDRITLEITF